MVILRSLISYLVQLWLVTTAYGQGETTDGSSCSQNNIAREGTATQVDTFMQSGYFLSASKAIDGDNRGM
ncbi:hypothetical protein ACHWQZ_G013108 [Mnemiopsis leidyi]